jgi:hypothetical protein
MITAHTNCTFHERDHHLGVAQQVEEDEVKEETIAGVLREIIIVRASCEMLQRPSQSNTWKRAQSGALKTNKTDHFFA